jgi:TolB-like protein
MLRIFSFLLVFFGANIAFSQTKSVAILDFDNISGIAKYDGLGKAMSSMLITDIEVNVSPKRLQLVERAQIQKVLKEQNFQSSSGVDKTTTVKVGKILGVKYLLVGDIYILDDILVINARLTDTETGEIKFSKKQEGKLSTWLILKTNIAKDLALELSLPFLEPNIPDSEINVATITTFGNAVMAKDEGKIEKAEELLNTVQEFSPNFKYSDDLKIQLDDLKKQVGKNTASIQILEKSGGRIINADSYDELRMNLQNGLTSNSEQIEYLIKLFDNYPSQIEQNFNLFYNYPTRNSLGYSEESFLEDVLLIKQLYARSLNKKVSAKYALGRLKSLIPFVVLTYYGNFTDSHKNIPLEKRMPKIFELTTQLRELIILLEIDELEKNRLGLYISENLLEAIVPISMEQVKFMSEETPIDEKGFFETLSHINSYIYIEKEIKYYSSKILTDNEKFMLSALYLIDDIYYYKKFVSFILEYSSNVKNFKYSFEYTDELEKIFNYNKIKSNDNFHIIELGSYFENIQILNNIFFVDNYNNIKLNLNKFQDQFTFSIKESNFFTYFMSSVKERPRDKGEVIGSFNRILLFRNSPTEKYEIICLF